MPETLYSAQELRAIVQEVQQDAELTPEELAEGWLIWFYKRAERHLKAAAQFGYSQVTLDLPAPLAKAMHKEVFRALCKEVRAAVPGCAVCIVEEEYEGALLYKVEISWA